MFSTRSMSAGMAEDSISVLLAKAQAVVDSIDNLITRYPAATSFEKRKDFISELSLMPVKFSPIVAQLKSRLSTMNEAETASVTEVEGLFREAMSKAVTHGEHVSRPPSGYVTQLPKQIMDAIRVDDERTLSRLLSNMVGRDSLKTIDHGLRNAAHFGSVKCLSLLCGPYPKRAFGNIFSAGDTKKIAMHRAIEAGRANCVAILLNTMSTDDGRAPVAQLLHGEAPNRPLDSLQRLESNAQCIAICDAILASPLEDYYEVSAESRAEVITTVSQLRLTRFEAEAQQAVKPSSTFKS